MSGDDLLSVNEAAEVLNVKPRFIRRIVSEKRIEVVRIGRHVRIRRQALHDFISASMVPALR